MARTLEDVRDAVNRLSLDTVLGFDTETPPAFRKGKTHAPTLVQLAGSREIVLFPLKWQPLGPELISLFENENIVKTGVAVHDDMRFLGRIVPFEARSVVDLSLVAQKNNVENLGLRGLVAAFLGLRISKGERCSNWGNRELTPRQIRYAATDAWASRAVYLAMREADLDFSQAVQSPAGSLKPVRAPRRRHKRSPESGIQPQ